MMVVTLALSVVWGAVATYCFFRAWMAALCVIACVVGFVRRNVGAGVLWSLLWNQASVGAAHGVVVVLSFGVFWRLLQMGRSAHETLVFLIAASAVMFYVFPTIPGRIDRIWRSTVEPEDDPPPR